MQCNIPAMNAVLRSILHGQLRLREYGPLLSAIGMRCDGSAEMINWGARQRDRSHFTPQPVHIVADPDYTVAFTVEDSGTRLQLTARAKPHLLNLPHALRARIFELVVSLVEGTHVNLDKDTKFSCGLIHVNRDIYHGWRDQFLYQNNFVLSMITN
jgi:hypothetical protein